MSTIAKIDCLYVKVDAKDRRLEYLNLKKWSKYFVRIEAIKCFPCYVKVILLRNEHDTDSNSIIRITVPGLQLQIASSRTKEFTYGFFWKCNRKRNSIFMAFDSDLARSAHMNWVKESIRTLERYRQEFLEIRRASRCSTEIGKLTDPFSNYQNLGPLPPLPDETMCEASRRQSRISGIYEEIADLRTPLNKLDERHKSTGIYEEMHINPCMFPPPDQSQTPPPLPPRRRINTLDRGEEKMTNPDNLLNKKRKYKFVLESIFGVNYRRGDHNQHSYLVSTEARTIDAKMRSEMRLLDAEPTNLMRNKRNSFSTPELAIIEELKLNEEEVDDDWQDVSCMSLLSESLDVSREQLNISQKIRPNFNLSGNTSCINLVGCNFNAIRESEIGVNRGNNELYCVMKPLRSLNRAIVDYNSGYCPMGTVGFDLNKVEKLDQLNDIEVAEENLMKNITFGRGSNPDCRRNDEFITPKKKNQREIKEEDLYENVQEQITPKQKYLIDDKIPSYFPNESSPPPKITPKRLSRFRTPSPSSQTISRAVPNIYSVPRNNSPVLMDSPNDMEKLKQSLTDSISKLSISNNQTTVNTSPSLNISTTTPEKNKLVAAPSPHKYSDKCSLKADFASLRRFASLPRFRKLDLSPLKIKLNSVLQRHNSEF